MKNNPKAKNNKYCCVLVQDQDFLLTNTSDLNDLPCKFQYMAKHIEDSCIKQEFQQGELFFYELTEFKTLEKSPDNILQIERGIGSLYNKSRQTFLKRISPLSNEHGKTSRFTDFTDEAKLFLQTYVPQDYRELFSLSNSIIATEVEECPSPVILEEKTLLGRLGSSIQSINNLELQEMIGDDFASKLLERDTNDLRSPSSKFSLNGNNSIIISNYILLNGVKRRPARKKKGQMIYNETKGAFEYFTGKEWRTIAWK